MTKGVECPNIQCFEKFVWDWCQDIWETAEGHENCNENSVIDETKETITYTCPTCGCFLSAIIYDTILGIEEWVLNDSQEWIDADWEEHAAE